MRAVRHILTSLLLATTQVAAAAELSLACRWEPPDPILPLTDKGAREAARFYSKADAYAYFAIDAEKQSIRNAGASDAQDLILPQLSLTADAELLRITAPEPNIKGTKGRESKILIEINRFSLKSTMALAMTDSQDRKIYGYWVRAGQCFPKQI